MIEFEFNKICSLARVVAEKMVEEEVREMIPIGESPGWFVCRKASDDIRKIEEAFYLGVVKFDTELNVVDVYAFSVGMVKAIEV